MDAPKKRVRHKGVGFIGVNLSRGGDISLLERLEKEVNSNPELDRSKVIRIALTEYFEKRDGPQS
jgi:metal-responsive CopG/Arc/MetJ family transcriptional regulator